MCYTLNYSGKPNGGLQSGVCAGSQVKSTQVRGASLLVWNGFLDGLTCNMFITSDPSLLGWSLVWCEAPRLRTTHSSRDLMVGVDYSHGFRGVHLDVSLEEPDRSIGAWSDGVDVFLCSTSCHIGRSKLGTLPKWHVSVLPSVGLFRRGLWFLDIFNTWDFPRWNSIPFNFHMSNLLKCSCRFTVLPIFQISARFMAIL